MHRKMFLLGMAIALSACGQSGAREEKVSARTIVFDSFIDFPVVDDFAKKLSSERYDTVQLSSPGGNPLAALRLLETLEKHAVDIEVYDECMSACAEIALLAKNDVIFVGNPVFGVHYNAYSTDILLEKFGLRNEQTCYKNNFLAKYSKFIKNENYEEVYKKFSHDMIDKLDFYDSRYTYNISKTSGCPGVEFASKRSFWFPTSNQLEAYFGKKFEGSLAADDLKADMEKFRDAAGRNRYVVIGDRSVFMRK